MHTFDVETLELVDGLAPRSADTNLHTQVLYWIKQFCLMLSNSC